MTGVHAAVAVLAVYRLTRLVVEDKITERWRAWATRFSYRRRARKDDTIGWNWTESEGWNPVEGRLIWDLHQWEAHFVADEEPPKIAYLVHCFWCAGLWVSAASCGAWLLVPALAVPVAYVLALSATTGIIARFVDA